MSLTFDFCGTRPFQAMFAELIPDVPEEIEIQHGRTKFYEEKVIDQVRHALARGQSVSPCQAAAAAAEGLFRPMADLSRAEVHVVCR